jgi:mutator protein MutT
MNRYDVQVNKQLIGKGVCVSTKRKGAKRTNVRAAAILIEDGKVALIERHRAGNHYFVFPGGGVEYGEWPTEAVKREIQEELGLTIEVKKLIAEVIYGNRPQYYFLVVRTGGEFGTGAGGEMSSSPNSRSGSYQPVWAALEDLDSLVIYPPSVVRLIKRSALRGWPEDVQRYRERLRK